MRFPIVAIVILLLVNALVDLYVYAALRTYFRNRVLPKLQAWSAVVLALALVACICMPKRGGGNGELLVVMWTLYAYFSIYLPKYIFIIFDVLSRIPCIFRRRRWQWMSWTGFGVGVGVFLAMWWGALFNRFQLQVVDVDVPVANLPKAFDGLTIAQISDLHVGSFGKDDDFVKRLVAKVNSLHPDVIVFTGDIVNRRSSELLPFADALAALHAPMGVYSVLGNHDYGDYSSWPDDAAKAKNMAQLKKLQAQMGWRMLNNETCWLRLKGDSLALIGVENIGDAPFPIYGDLSKAYPRISDNNTKILLTHNPAHWTSDIKDSPSNIALTLAGHTHAMQLEVFGLSPAAWRYGTWGGLYADSKGQKLYVNIGAGEVGFPARIGATPEITLFTLKSYEK